jgi:excinuclease ABC subunit C
MEEILKRRFTRGLKENENVERKEGSPVGFSLFPDIIMVDGGKGHVNKAKAVLDDLGVDIPVCGLVKDRFHKTRGIIYDNREIIPDKDSLAFKLIYGIQEEAHRFAISYHRSLRSKDLFHSELDGISLVGEKRRVALLKHFGSISEIKKASQEELAEVEGMNSRAAQNVYDHFREKEEK